MDKELIIFFIFLFIILCFPSTEKKIALVKNEDHEIIETIPMTPPAGADWTINMEFITR